MTWNSDGVLTVFFSFPPAGLSCQRSGCSTGNQLGPVIQSVSTSELSVRINSRQDGRRKRTSQSCATTWLFRRRRKKTHTSVAGAAVVPGVAHYTSSTANGIYWFIGHNVNLWKRHSRGGRIRVSLKTNWRFPSNPKVSTFSEWKLHGQGGDEKHFCF